ncbi:aspartyl protease family protein [Flavisolibacter sp. BT320]|nr:aspartyl protease family protein [Flavisolibacter longurius]
MLAVFFGSTGKIHAHEIELYTGKNKIVIPVLESDSASCILPFNRVGNLMVVKAKVDTMEGNFILDTGAPHLVLNATYFRDYPIEMQQDGQQTSIAGQGDYIYKTKVRELAFGALNFFQLEADVTNLGNIENAKGFKVLGLLGLDLLRQCEMIIDFEKSQIYLHRIGKKEASSYKHEMLQDTSQYRVFPVAYTNNRLVTTAEVAGKKLKLVIDCAAESNILDSRLPDKILSLVTINRRVKVTGPGYKKMDALFGNLANMKMGDTQIDNLPVLVINLEYTCFNDGSSVNGVLGVDFLSQHKIGFNFVQRKMYIWK